MITSVGYVQQLEGWLQAVTQIRFCRGEFWISLVAFDPGVKQIIASWSGRCDQMLEILGLFFDRYGMKTTDVEDEVIRLYSGIDLGYIAAFEANIRA